MAKKAKPEKIATSFRLTRHCLRLLTEMSEHEGTSQAAQVELMTRAKAAKLGLRESK